MAIRLRPRMTMGAPVAVKQCAFYSRWSTVVSPASIGCNQISDDGISHLAISTRCAGILKIMYYYFCFPILNSTHSSSVQVHMLRLPLWQSIHRGVAVLHLSFGIPSLVLDKALAHERARARRSAQPNTSTSSLLSAGIKLCPRLTRHCLRSPT